MASQYPESIYCSSLLPVASLDAELTLPDSVMKVRPALGDPPDIALMKKYDLLFFHRWLELLEPPLAAVARLMMQGATQAAIARRLNLTEAAISKRVTRIVKRARVELLMLRDTPLLN